MIIVISGSVGSGKTFISDKFALKFDFEVVHLNEIVTKFKLNDDLEAQTFDFDLDNFLKFIEREIKKAKKENKNIIFESHFAHFINPDLVDILFIINRDLKELKKEYIKRKYNSNKIKDNLEVESFNLCFYEAIEEGYGEEVQGLKFNNNNNKINIFSIENNKKVDLILEDIIKIVKNN